jgi:amino acid adenylation domain-containing protein
MVKIVPTYVSVEDSEISRSAHSQQLLDEQQRRQLLVEWNNTSADFPRTKCVHDLFAEQASETHDAIALVFGDHCLTYAELDTHANQLAHYLRSIGVGPESIVGLCLERSLEMIVGMLGILKAGGAYLPLDEKYPPEHIAYLLEDAGVLTVLTSSVTNNVLIPQSVRTVTLDLESGSFLKQSQSAPVSGTISSNLLYVMYTSGSSGKPKGVGVVHHNVTRLVRNTNYVHIMSGDVFLQLAPITFDAATFEIWGALLNGAKLILYPQEALLDLLKLKHVIQEGEVSILWLTAGLFHGIVDADLQILSSVKQLLAGGDVLSASHVRRVLDDITGCQVINGYGPTEGTTFSVCFPIRDSSSIDAVVPIGRPISNTNVYVLDADLELAPIGATGELFISGEGLSRGYFHRPDLTAGSFVPNPYGAGGSRQYRTGDMVRYVQDGLLEFVGRVDFQVKVRGYRIELEELEAALLLDPDVRQAVVVALPEPKGDKQLIAYVVGAGNATNGKELRARLAERLPEYMIPSAFVFLEALPLTPNGKVDRKALPLPERGAHRPPSQDRFEEAVAEIWTSMLGVSEVGVDDDFFDLGGTSLALINIVMEMGKRFNIPLDAGIVARGATVKDLARAVKEKMAAANPPIPSIEQTVAEIWASTLGVSEVGVNDDFFDLGGTSLALINIVMEMGKRFSIPLDAGIVARGATVKDLAQAVKEKMASLAPSLLERVAA